MLKSKWIKKMMKVNNKWQSNICLPSLSWALDGVITIRIVMCKTLQIIILRRKYWQFDVKNQPFPALDLLSV